MVPKEQLTALSFAVKYNREMVVGIEAGKKIAQDDVDRNVGFLSEAAKDFDAATPQSVEAVASIVQDVRIPPIGSGAAVFEAVFSRLDVIDGKLDQLKTDGKKGGRRATFQFVVGIVVGLVIAVGGTLVTLLVKPFYG